MEPAPFKILIPSFALISLCLLGCSSSDDVGSCGSGIALDFGNSLVLGDLGAIESEREVITKVVRGTVVSVNNSMSIDNLIIRISASTSQAIPEIGIGGFNPNANEVHLWIDPTFSNLSQAINTELAPMLAHEMHHAKRRRTVGYGSTLLEASVTEGLADCFAMEITGIAPPRWSVAITGSDLDDWINTARSTWTNNSYDHDKWFLASSAEVPRWTGYSIGFKLVKDYITQNSTRKASDLFDEPADSFAQ